MKSAAIIVNWNSWTDLESCLIAIEKQSLPFFRTIVIDNASTEVASYSLNEWRDKCNVEFVFMDSNVGFAKANNIAISIATECEWVALVNPDAMLDREWHREMSHAARINPKAASFSSALVMANDRRTWDGLGDAYHISGLVWRKSHGKPMAKTRSAVSEVFSPCAAAAFYNRESVLEVGGFDEEYFCYVEDVDLGFRLRLMGHDSLLIPTAIGYHVGSATTGGKHSDFAVYHGHRNLVWTFVKNMPGILFWLLLPMHVAVNVITILWFASRGQGLVILRAKWDAIKGIPKAWSKRQQVQRARRCSVGDIWRMLDKRLVSHG